MVDSLVIVQLHSEPSMVILDTSIAEMWSPKYSTQAYMTPAMRDFVERFDKGLYADLVK
jgi:hypothetical protein